MKVGDLIRYRETHDKSVFGIIVQDLGFFKKYNEEAVKVHWFDDHKCTKEKISELTDSKGEHFEVFCASR